MLDRHSENAPIVPFEPEFFLGQVSQVGAATLRFEFSKEHEAAEHGSLAIKAEVGMHLIVAVREYGVIGVLSSIDTLHRESGNVVTGVLNFTHTLDGKSGKIVNGIINMPRVGCRVYIAPSQLVQLAAEADIKNTDGTDKLTISFARLQDTQQTRLRFTPEMMFGRHCAVLGTTGGGKSWTLAKLIEETGKLRSKVILFDATGEFGTLQDGVHHLFIGQHPKPSQLMREVVVPYYELTERDLFAIFKPKGQSQAPKLRAAIKSLKLAQVCPELALDGTIMKANRSKKEFERAYRDHYTVVENQQASFDIHQLARQIEHECVRPNRSAMEPQFWGDVSAVDQAQCVSLINRVRDITQSSNLAPIFEPRGKPSLLRVIDAFMEDDTARVLCVSLQYLSFAHHAREIIANAVGRHLMRRAQEETFRRKPLLVVVDEAHQFLNKHITDDDGEYPLDAFGLIAKEGRKYALSICMSTQRPRDIPEGILSQMGTMIVHRLINDKDRSVVESACGEMDKASLEALPTLGPGQAMILGSAFPMPLEIQIEAPNNPPNSTGPNYQKFWNF
jgi:hypothetical protein